MLAVCQIPEDTLHNLSTDALVQTCLWYPMLDVFLFAYGESRGLDLLLKEFNGARELVARKDAGYYLLLRYKDFAKGKYDSSWTPDHRGGFPWRLLELEFYLSLDSVISNMDDSAREELLSTAVHLFKSKQLDTKHYGSFYFPSSAFLAGRIMLREGHGGFMGSDSKVINLSDYVTKGKKFDKATTNSVMQEAEQLEKKNGRSF